MPFQNIASSGVFPKRGKPTDFVGVERQALQGRSNGNANLLWSRMSALGMSFLSLVVEDPALLLEGVGDQTSARSTHSLERIAAFQPISISVQAVVMVARPILPRQCRPRSLPW